MNFAAKPSRVQKGQSDSRCALQNGRKRFAGCSDANAQKG
jgi:hypothetical protein